ncbi:hypothetical protein BU24DRAFT_365726, partial [Aaosphaeria arxii CBS 175.79]
MVLYLEPTILSWRHDSKTVFLKPLSSLPPEQQTIDSLWFLDLEVFTSSHDDPPDHRDTSALILDPSSEELAETFANLFDTLTADGSSNGHNDTDALPTILRLVFSKTSGFAARSDFLEYRLKGTPHVTLALSFLSPLSKIQAINPKQIDFSTLFTNSIGAIVLRPSTPSPTLLDDLSHALTARLSIPFILPTPPIRSRIFWVQGRADIESSIQFYTAARALGITLVVLDQPGHWLESPTGPYAHYREAFIPVSVDGDAGLTARIVDAVRAYPEKVDGIVTISDVRLPFVAAACETLGLPTEAAEAYWVAGDKGRTRELEDAAAGRRDGVVLGGADEVEGWLEREGSGLRFPLVVKPCSGWNSDCVAKVGNVDELREAVLRASTRHAKSPSSSTKVVVEPYIDGPEIDANFIVLDGKVLFCDISDDFPCSGDGETGIAGAANFMETLMDVPTALPAEEKEMLRESLTKSISRLGFRSGIFHCEARVRDSRTQYQRDDDGIVDLHVADHVEGTSSPTCYLHEVNARSPGYINCVAALLAYGVDYYAVRLLLSLGSRENDRVRLLSQPFLNGKPQYVLGVVVLPPTRAGIMASSDAVGDFLVENPGLREHVVHHQVLRKKGEFVEGPDSKELLAVGYIIVASRKGRRECLQLAKEIREKFSYRL